MSRRDRLMLFWTALRRTDEEPAVDAELNERLTKVDKRLDRIARAGEGYRKSNAALRHARIRQ